MCIQVVIESVPPSRVTNKTELRDLLGVEPVRLPGYSVWCDYDCLCPCDVPATLAAAGLQTFKRDEHGNYYVTPNV